MAVFWGVESGGLDKNIMAKIELNKEQTVVFKWFLKFYPLWRRVYFELRPGSFTCHIDRNGIISKAELNLFPNKSELSTDITQEIENEEENGLDKL